MNIRPKNRDALSGNLLVGGNSPDAKSLAVLATLDISALIIASAPLPHFRWIDDLYRGWKNPVSASRLCESRISVCLGSRVSKLIAE